MSGQVDNPVFLNDDNNYNNGISKHPPIKNSNCEKKLDIGLKDLKNAEEVLGEYDPYLHRDVHLPTTNSETLFHLLKGSMGTGILSMPLAFYHSGYLVGVVFTVIIGTICTYCIHMIIQAAYELCKRRKEPSLSYTTTVQYALLEGPEMFRRFAPMSIHIVNSFLIVYQLGCCCVYTVFIAENIKSVADEYIEKFDVKIWMLIILLPLILINYIRNLKYLAPFSTFANCITIGSFGIILYYLIKTDIILEERNPTGKIEDFPLFFGTVLFALEAIGVILPLENEMKTPKSFGGKCGVLNIGMIFIIILYVIMGLFGYLAFGANIRETITLNLPQTEILAQVAKILLAIAIFVTHPLQLYVGVELIWNEYLQPRLEKSRFQLFYEYTLRTCLVLLTFALAVAIPKLDLFISLVGAFCLSALGLAFPAIIETTTFWYSLHGIKGKLIILKNCFLILFGIFGLIVGSYTSLEKIVKYFTE